MTSDDRTPEGAAGHENELHSPTELVKHLAYAEASLMLMETLMRLLVEARVLKREAVIEAVEEVISTKKAMVTEGQHPQIASVAGGILSTLANSLAAANDDPVNHPPPALQTLE